MRPPQRNATWCIYGSPVPNYCHKGIPGDSLTRKSTSLIPKRAVSAGCRGMRYVYCCVDETESIIQHKPNPSQRLQGALPSQQLPPGAHSTGDLVHDRYEIVGVLGKGGNAVTYEAIDTSTNSTVAIKCLSLSEMKDWKQLDLFEREAKTLQSLNHPGIPNYIEYFERDLEKDRCFYIVQELAMGKTVSQMLQEGWRASKDEVRRIALSLLAILEYLSSLSPPVVHRDVKPENIVIEDGKSGGRIFLVDFGGVQGIATDAMITGSTIVGTYGYMAPEQFRGEAQPASDLYGLGATLLFLLSGRPPNTFRQERLKIVFKDIVTVDQDFEDLLNGLLEPLPEDRISARSALRILNLEKPPAVASLTSMRSRRNKQPAGSRVVVKRINSGLWIDIPPSGLTGETVMTGSFAIAWNSFIVFWTWSALTAGGGLLPLLFSLPFWAAGAQLTKSAIGSSLVRETLEINRHSFTVKKQLAFIGGRDTGIGAENSRSKESSGQSQDLTKAEVITTVVINGVPQMALKIYEGVKSYIFGEGLDPVELNWLAGEINSMIQGLGD